MERGAGNPHLQAGTSEGADPANHLAIPMIPLNPVTNRKSVRTVPILRPTAPTALTVLTVLTDQTDQTVLTVPQIAEGLSKTDLFRIGIGPTSDSGQS